MSGKPIEIKLDAETTGAERGIDNTADSLDDLTKGLGDVSDAGKDTERDLGKAFDGASDDAKDAARTIDRDLTKALEETAQAGKRAGDDIGAGVTHGAREASVGTDTLKENAAANAKEMGASFTDVNSVLGAMQGFAAEALEGFGPAGLAAGVAAAAGLGLAVSAITAADEKAQELHDEAVALAQALRDAGTDGTEVASILGDRFEEFGAKIATSGSGLKGFLGEKQRTNLDTIVTLLDEGTISAQQLDRAFKSSSGAERLEGMKAILKDASREAERLNSSGHGLTSSQEELYIAASKVADSMKDQIAQEQQADALNQALARSTGQTVEQYEAQQQALEHATEVHESYSSALESSGDAVTVYEGVLERKKAAEQAAAQATADATAESTDSWEDYANSVTVTTDDLIAEWNRQAAEAAAFEANLAEIGANGGQALADELRAKGPEVAAATAQAIAESDPAKQREAIDAHARATGAAMGGSMAAGISSQQGAVQGAVNGVAAGVSAPGVSIPIYADTSAFNESIRAIQNTTYRANVIANITGMRVV